MIMYISVLSLPAVGHEFSSGLLLGHSGGPGFQVYGMVSELAHGFPFKLRFGLEYVTSNPGNAPDARRIFINNATNGTPEKKGYRKDLKMDLTFPFKIFSMNNSFIFVGPRYSKFTANFKYIGGNEDFDVTCDQWGWGLGLEKYYKISTKLDLLAITGLDYYLGNTLKGHDTSYSPDGTSVNPREDFQYKDADKAIKQPRYEFVLMLGIQYYFGR